MDTYRGISLTEEHQDTVSPGLERLAPNVFFRMLNCWKIGDVSATNFKQLPPKVTFPVESIVHILDNFNAIENGLSINDTPNLDIPFILNENFRKYIYHVQRPVTDTVIRTPNDYVYRTLQLQRNLEKYRSQNSGRYLFVRQLDPLKVRGPFLGIINHNPTFRLFCRGVMPHWRALNHCLASVFNVAMEMPDKTHYFIIPLTPKVYTKSKFQQSSMRITNGTLVYKTNYQYLFFVHLYNFMNQICKLETVFDQIPSEYYPKFNLVFKIGDEYLFWTLKDLLNLNERNQIYTRIFNHFNGFMLYAVAKEQAKQVTVVDSDVTDEKNRQINDAQVEQQIVNNMSEITGIQEQDTGIIVEDIPEEQKDTSEQDERELTLLLNSIQSVQFTMGDKDDTLDVSDIKDMVEKEIDESEVEQDSPVSVEEDKTTPTQIQEERVVEFTDTVYKDDDLYEVKLPNKDINPLTTKEEVKKIGESYMDHLDKRAEITIKKNSTLTSSQKDRARNMAQSYKNVVYKGKSIAAHITEPVPPKINHIGDLTSLTKEVPDDSMIKSSICDMDRVYLSTMLDKHIASVAASMVEQGLYLQEIEEATTNTELTQTKHYKFKYKTVTGKSHSIDFTFPIVREDGTFLINGIKSTMLKQLNNKPIAKISPTRVSLASNYNKTIVDKRTSTTHDYLIYLTDLLNKIKDESPNTLKIEYGITHFEGDQDICHEHAQIAKKIKSIEIKHKNQNATSYLTFVKKEDRKTDEHFKSLSPTDWQEIEKYEQNNSVTFIGIKTGHAPYTPARYYLDRGSRLLMIGVHEGVKFNVPISILDLLQGATDIYMKKPLTEWVDIKILDGIFPVGFLLCYRFGLLVMLRRLNVKYKIINTRSRSESDRPDRSTDVVIKFKQSKALVIPRYPLKTSLIFQGLTMFNTKNFDLEDFEVKDTYHRLLMDKKQGATSTNYLLGIDDTFDLFVDVLTYEKLVQMGEPTTFDGLLIRATEMLATPYHKEASAMANHCLRSYERMVSILYNEMSTKYKAYRKQRGNTPFSINPNAVLQRIIQDQSVLNVEDINPIHDIKTTTKVTYLGSGGRTAQSFTAEDRRYPTDGIGLLSEATVDSGNVAITAHTSMDPTIANLYGLIEDNKDKKLEPTQLLSVSALLMPCATQDDPKRMAYLGHQLSHVMPTETGQCGRLRTGYEKIIAHRCNDLYAYTAKQDGTVIDVNDQLKVVKIKYQDGSVHAFSYAPQYGECSDMHTEQKQVLTIKKGDKFKAHEVLRYNPEFFELNQDNNRQVDYKLGNYVNVAFVENSLTFEDGSAVTKEFSDEFRISPIENRLLSIATTYVVHEYKKVGDHVDINDPLIVFEPDDVVELTGVTTDSAALAYLEKLNRTAPKAKTKGEIVDIRIIYAGEIADMHPSVAKMIKTLTNTKTAVSKYTSDTTSVYQFSGTSQVPVGSKYKGILINEDVVVLQYLIKETITHQAGDKMVIDSSLKTVSGKVIAVTPTTESGDKIHVIFSASSVYNRIVNSPILVGIAEKVLEKAEKNVVEEYFK